MRITSIVITLLLISSSSCAQSDQSDVRKISGDKYDYRIPAKYIKKSDSIRYFGEVIGDKSESMSLLISLDDVDQVETNKGWELSLLLFLDKSYKPSVNLLRASKALLEDARRVGAFSLFHHYRRTLGGLEKDYYLTFDPFNDEVAEMSERDFFIRMQEEKSLRIEGIERASKPSCVLHSVFDGIALQLTTIGKACNVENFQDLKNVQDQLLVSWRVLRD